MMIINTVNTKREHKTDSTQITFYCNTL